VLSVAWALAPVLTVGLGTAPAFTYAAFRLRVAAVWWWAGIYWAFLITALAFDRPGQALPASSWRSQIQEWIQWIVLILMGTTHAFLIRRQLVDGTRVGGDQGEDRHGVRRALGLAPRPATEGVHDA
jgi:hypothetical protein